MVQSAFLWKCVLGCRSLGACQLGWWSAASPFVTLWDRKGDGLLGTLDEKFKFCPIDLVPVVTTGTPLSGFGLLPRATVLV